MIKKQGHHYVDNLRHAIDKGKHDSIEIARHVSEDVSVKVKKLRALKKRRAGLKDLFGSALRARILGAISGVVLFFMLYLYFSAFTAWA